MREFLGGRQLTLVGADGAPQTLYAPIQDWLSDEVGARRRVCLPLCRERLASEAAATTAGASLARPRQSDCRGYRVLMADDGLGQLLAEQIAYYRALAPEYLEAVLDLPGGSEIEAALDAFAPAGDVLELACGPGSWTPRLLQDATSVTAVDAAPEMLASAREAVGDDDRVRFVLADLFTWRPERRYDVVFFGFWLSHVPPERFDAFWALVDDCLAPGGRVFFADDGYRTADELVDGAASSTIRRRLRDGSTHRVVKVPHTPRALERRLAQLGWEIVVSPTAGPFFWGAGGRAKRATRSLTGG